MTQEAPKRRCVLHLAVEYPSRNRDTNTPAVRNFIQANPLVDYRVFALRRTAKPWLCNALQGDDNGDPKVTSMRYWGLPYGVMLFISMLIVSWRVIAQLKREQLTPDLVHAHKFSFEGIAGWLIARHLKIPLALSVRGEAEQKTLRFKPHYRPLYKRILKRATRIYYVSAWFRPQMANYFELDKQQQQLLPNFVADRPWQLTPKFDPYRLVSVMDLNVLEKKGLPQLLQGFAIAAKTMPKLRLEIIGGGFAVNLERARALIRQHKLNGSVTLLGPMDNRLLLNKLNRYAGLVLPSRNETFGMVFVEALLSGVPIVHSRHTGIDGFIDGFDATVAVDPLDSNDIAQGIERLCRHQQPWRQWLLEHHQLVHQRFSRDHYISEYNQTFKLLPQIAPAQSP